MVAGMEPIQCRKARLNINSDRRGSKQRQLASLLLVFMGISCDGGLAPPAEEPVGAIRGVVEYSGAWPAADSLYDLRYVAMRFVPRDTTDFLQLNRLIFSDPLELYVERDTFLISGVRPGVFVYSGVAQQYASNIFAWRPVGLYDVEGGVFRVHSNDTVQIGLRVDFADLPPFPPPEI